MVATPDVQLSKPWTDALFGFKLSLQTQNRAESTITNRLCSARIMARHAIADGLDGPADVDYAWLARYLSGQYAARQRGGPANLQANMVCFWSWYCAEFGTDSPMARIKRPREVLPDVPVLSDEQIGALMDATAGAGAEQVRNRAIILLLLDSGLRRMEVSRLDCSDLDLEAGTIRVRCGKGGKARTALIGTTTAQALWRYLRTRAMPTTAVKICPAMVENVMIDGDTLDHIITGLAGQHPGEFSKNELSQLALSRVEDRSDAGSWIAALAAIVDELPQYPIEYAEFTVPAGTADELNDQLSLTPMSDAAAADEVARLGSKFPGMIDQLKAVTGILRSTPAVGFTASEDRMYDEPAGLSASDSASEIARLTGTGRTAAMFGNTAQPVSSENDEVVRLTQDQNLSAYFAKLPDREDVLDIGAPSISDLSGRTSGPDDDNGNVVDQRTASQIVADSLARCEGYFDNQQMADSSGNRSG